MTLLDHLKSRQISVAAFAAKIDEATNTIRKIAYGQRQPSLALAVKISAATRGDVAEADLLLPAQQEAA
ncbi:helix-turn-helix domain-containing protein [Sphingomonas nostoxanthinifaciens]|uniref:helix-turn-helix domain-containing protein n=1 Tax=Sphingomonas nostoxanthinifaciens TaxID=2872652 RepID=UPI001CC20448|nr:helix-turn-helix transcriptional regulator [Sphingomonas nostoxanthinifaciens]UAK23645.1 helix-turn-helix transcriptional regulator [Sphingomonas nostoxanthinifaciens]